jgi:hypothetical protein
MFVAFQRGELPLFHLNFGTIILLDQLRQLLCRGATFLKGSGSSWDNPRIA